MRQPTIYLPHGGGPCFFMDWDPPDTWAAMGAWLARIVAELPERPRALLVVSAHWEAERPTVQTGPAPALYFDYYNFPPHTYRLTWPAPGAPDVARRAAALLRGAGIATDEDPARGFDHGVFIPLKLAVPGADIPTVQLSLRHDLDPAAHVAIGRALAPLRDEGVLILGSGMSYHNLRRFFGTPDTERSAAFDAWLADTVALPAPARAAKLTGWAQAPHARDVHPREEHLLPLHVCAGAAGDDAGRVVFRDQVLGAWVSGVQFG